MFSLRWLLFASALLSLASVQAHVHDENFVPDHVLVATQQNIDVDCNTRPSVVFNGTAPGPTLHLKENRTAWIRVYNNIEGQNLTVVSSGLHCVDQGAETRAALARPQPADRTLLRWNTSCQSMAYTIRQVLRL